MQVTRVIKGRTVKTVWIDGVTDESADDVLAAAMLAAGESRTSLYGSNVAAWDGSEVTVNLYTS